MHNSCPSSWQKIISFTWSKLYSRGSHSLPGRNSWKYCMHSCSKIQPEIPVLSMRQSWHGKWMGCPPIRWLPQSRCSRELRVNIERSSRLTGLRENRSSYRKVVKSGNCLQLSEFVAEYVVLASRHKRSNRSCYYEMIASCLDSLVLDGRVAADKSEGGASPLSV